MKKFLSTKMTRSHQTSSERRELYVIGALFLPLFILSWLWPGLLGSVVAPIFTPFLSTETKLRLSLTGSDEVPSSVDAELLKTLTMENTELRSLLGDDEEKRIAAGVIGRPTNLPYDVLVIDKGSADGIMKDAPVFVGLHQAIGTVIAVYERSSIVALITTPGWRSTVYIYGPNIYTTALGQGGGVARVHVPQGIELTEGDVVIVPSLSGGIYGAVRAVDSLPSRPEQYGYVSIDVPINSLHFVSVGERPLSVIDFEQARGVVNEAEKELLLIDLPEGVLIEVESQFASSTASSTAATSTPE